MRLIDADALSARMYHDAFETDSDMQKWDSGCWVRYKMFERAIADAPTVEPDRKKGHWIRHDEIKNVYGGICIECSECGEEYVVQHIEYEKYCRNCGADMRGEYDG